MHKQSFFFFKVLLLFASFNFSFFIFKSLNFLPIDDITTSIANLEGYYSEKLNYLTLYSISSPQEFLYKNALHASLLSLLNNIFNSPELAVYIFAEFSVLSFSIALILYSSNISVPLILSFIPLVVSTTFSQSRSCLAISICFILLYRLKSFPSFLSKSFQISKLSLKTFPTNFTLLLAAIFFHPLSLFFLIIFLMPFLQYLFKSLLMRLSLTYVSFLVIVLISVFLGFFFNYLFTVVIRFSLLDNTQSSFFVYLIALSLLFSSFGLSGSFYDIPSYKYFLSVFRYVIIVSTLICFASPAFHRVYFLALPLYILIVTRSLNLRTITPLLLILFFSLRYIFAIS